MSELFNKISNLYPNPGSSLMSSGDTTVLAENAYKCSEGLCSSPLSMIGLTGRCGNIVCATDYTSRCVLDGENTRSLMGVGGTSGKTLSIRAITFRDGSYSVCGGLGVTGGGIVALLLCQFTNCKATVTGAGAIGVDGSPSVVTLFGTSFTGNSVTGLGGNDFATIDGGKIIVNNTCPSPYTSVSPAQGKHR